MTIDTYENLYCFISELKVVRSKWSIHRDDKEMVRGIYLIRISN